MRSALDEDISRKFYWNAILSIIMGLIIFFWGSGVYSIISTFNVYFRLSYVLLAYTIAFIFFAVYLEHRGVKVPYLFAGAGLLSFLVTFIGVCSINGVLWIIENFPPIDNLLIGLSLSILAGFVFIKLITSPRKDEYEYE
jgi:hypothetical protein